MADKIDLRPVSKVEITVLMDNYFDALLPGQPGVTRPPLARDGKVPTSTLIAEHGFSALVDVTDGQRSKRVLLDTGYNEGSVLHNMGMLGVDPESIQALMISHGHMDHTGAVNALVRRIGSSIPIYFHPHIFASRYIERPMLGLSEFPQPIDRSDLGQATLAPNEGPVTFGDNMILATGAVPRKTDFEKGMPGARIMKDGELTQDSMEDDQSMVINVKGSGLVIISGCAHAGIVNSMEYARRITGEDKVCAVIGGFHLAGPDMGPVVDSTIERIKEYDPKVVMPMHCSGFEAINRFRYEFPKSFVLSAVGAKLTLPFW